MIPRAYQRGFAADSSRKRIWLYQKGDPEPTLTSTKRAFKVSHFHTFTNAGGKKDSYSVEDIVSKIESTTMPAVRKIALSDEYTPRDLESLILFCAFCMIRVPVFRKNAERMGAVLVQELARSLDREGQLDEAPTVFGANKSLSQLLDEGHIKIQMDPVYYLASMSIFSGVADRIGRMNWTFVKAPPNVPFVFSDNPVVVYDPRFSAQMGGISLASRFAELTFPVSKQVCAFATWQNMTPAYLAASKLIVQQINMRTVLFAERFVGASKKSNDIASLIERYEAFKPTKRIQVIPAPDERGTYIIAESSLNSNNALQCYFTDLWPIFPFLSA